MLVIKDEMSDYQCPLWYIFMCSKREGSSITHVPQIAYENEIYSNICHHSNEFNLNSNLFYLYSRNH